MAIMKHAGAAGTDLFDRFFEDWPEMFRRPVLLWPEHRMGEFNIEEFTENGSFVVRAELAGIDPDRDVEVTVHDNILHIHAERHQEEKVTGRDYVRREVRYGAFDRELPLPSGATEKDVKASYADGMLEVRVPIPKEHAAAKIPIAKAAKR